MRKFIHSRRKKKNLPPGSAVYVGEIIDEPVQITVFDYDQNVITERNIAADEIEKCIAMKGSPSVTWINISNLSDAKLIQTLGEGFGLHPLVIEDILNTDQRPKFEDYGDYFQIVLKMLRWDENEQEIIFEQVTLILGPDYVLSFQERLGDVFEPVRDRIRNAKGRIRTMKSDYLIYCLMDAVVDGYFSILERLGDMIEGLETDLMSDPKVSTLHDIHQLKKESLYIRRSVWPLREAINGLLRSESSLVDSHVEVYLRDVYDHTIQVIDTMEAFRDMLAGLLDTYLSSQGNRMNEIMKVLTLIATIFIPLTFIAGIYGMNFEYMPELKWPWAYPAAWGVMLATGLVMMVYFKRRKWL